MAKDPYVYENTNVLINLANIKNQETLDNYETTLVNLALVEYLKSEPIVNSVYDIFRIHKVLFVNVYEWAGIKRTINISKEEYVLNGLSVIYSDYKNIDKDFKIIQKKFENIKWRELSKNDLITNIVRIISSMWQVHAFREGNTRCITTFLYLFMKNIGLKLNTEFINKHAKYFRNALVLASIGEYSEYNHLEEILKDAISVKIISDDSVKYKTIRGYNLDKYKYNYHSINDESDL